MSQNCGGSTDGGQSCPCRRCVPIPNSDPSTPVICRDCRHIESAHPAIPAPPTGVAGAMNMYKNAAKMSGLRSSTLKATQADAQAETNSGLKRKNIDSGAAGSSKSKKAKGKARNSQRTLGFTSHHHTGEGKHTWRRKDPCWNCCYDATWPGKPTLSMFLTFTDRKPG